MGCGFVEPVYQECLELELASRQIAFQSGAELDVQYKGRPLTRRYKPTTPESNGIGSSNRGGEDVRPHNPFPFFVCFACFVVLPQLLCFVACVSWCSCLFRGSPFAR
jgi:hypothetical protein